MRREYRRRLLRLVRARPDVGLLHYYLITCAMHYHYHMMVRRMASSAGPVVNVSGAGAVLVGAP